MEAKAFVFNAELQSQQSNSSPVLLEHYFSRHCHEPEVDDLPEPSQDHDVTDSDPCWVVVSDSYSDSNSDLDLDVASINSADSGKEFNHGQSSVEDNEDVPLTAPTTKVHSRPFMCAPTKETATHALCELEHVIHLPCNKGSGHKDPWLPLLMRTRIEQILALLWVFTEHKGLCKGQWIDASEVVAHAFGKKSSYG